MRAHGDGRARRGTLGGGVGDGRRLLSGDDADPSRSTRGLARSRRMVRQAEPSGDRPTNRAAAGDEAAGEWGGLAVVCGLLVVTGEGLGVAEQSVRESE